MCIIPFQLYFAEWESERGWERKRESNSDTDLINVDPNKFSLPSKIQTSFLSRSSPFSLFSFLTLFLSLLFSVQCPSRPNSHKDNFLFSLSLSSLLFLTHSLPPLILFEWLKMFWYQNVHSNEHTMFERRKQATQKFHSFSHTRKSSYFFHFLSTPVLSFGKSGFVYFMGTTSSVYPSIHDLVYNWCEEERVMGRDGEKWRASKVVDTDDWKDSRVDRSSIIERGLL